MKSIKIIATLVFFLFMGVCSIHAQTSTTIDEFTPEQRKLVQEQRDILKANRDAFKASLTPEQLAILNDATLNKQQKQIALVATFTEAQRNILAQSRENVKELKKDFKNTLTNEQRQQLHAQNGEKIRETIKDSRSRNIKHN